MRTFSQNWLRCSSKFFFCIDPSRTRKIEKLYFWDANNFTVFKHQQLENHKCKVYQPAYYDKVYQIFFKSRSINTVVSLPVFEILLFDGKTLLSPSVVHGAHGWKSASKKPKTYSRFVEITWKVIDSQAQEVLNCFWYFF